MGNVRAQANGRPQGFGATDRSDLALSSRYKRREAGKGQTQGCDFSKGCNGRATGQGIESIGKTLNE